MSQHRVLVCGGRNYVDHARIWSVLDHYHLTSGGFSVVIHGAARGADTLAGEWAELRGIDIVSFPADWSDGRAGGHRRNARMLREGKPTVVIAFPGGRGTENMIGQATRAGVPVLRIPAV